MKKLINHFTPISICGILAAATFGGASTEIRYAAKPTVEIRGGKFAFDPVIATVPQGQPVDVIARDGRWFHVTYAPQIAATSQPTAGVDGYVFEDALATERPPTTQPADAKSGPTPGGVLNSTDYAAAEGLDPDAFAKAVADSHRAMTDADAKFQAFEKAGHLGPDKPAALATPPATEPAH